jgi:nucleolar GTP-binding protein
MGFQTIRKVESAQKIIDAAFSKASKINVKKGKGAGADEIHRARRAEAAKLDAVNEVIHIALQRIIKDFPGLDNLTEFYSELLRVSLDFDKLKKALGAVNWADKKAKSLVIYQKGQIFEARSVIGVSKNRKAYLGRISSVLKQIDPELDYLEQCRRIIKEFPVIKQMPTVCIAGFPNVGKSTLLGKITTSKPEIKNYAFTTKTLNMGYIKDEKKEIQVIDTPGTLAREEKMNNIEKQAYLAIKYQADLIVYVFDPTDTYPLEDQEALFEIMKKYRKPIIIYLSKTDLASQMQIKRFDKYKPTTSKDELVEEIENKLVSN